MTSLAINDPMAASRPFYTWYRYIQCGGKAQSIIFVS
jgi:hypothetical protein